jgi:hypothetical protein
VERINQKRKIVGNVVILVLKIAIHFMKKLLFLFTIVSSVAVYGQKKTSSTEVVSPLQ